MEKLTDRVLKDYQMLQMTLKEFIDHIQQDLNDPASNSNRRTDNIMGREHRTEINISKKII